MLLCKFELNMKQYAKFRSQVLWSAARDLGNYLQIPEIQICFQAKKPKPDGQNINFLNMAEFFDDYEVSRHL